MGRGLFKPIGDGDAGVAEVVDAVQRAGYRGWYGIESETRLKSVEDDPAAAVKASLAKLRGMLPATQGRR